MNLAMNSREAMPDGGTAARSRPATRSCARRGRRRASARARDADATRAAGWPKEVAAHAFEPFFTTKAVWGLGVGSGSRPCYGIVTKARGRIELRRRRRREGTDACSDRASGRAPRRADGDRRPARRAAAARPSLVVEDADAVPRSPAASSTRAWRTQVISVESGVVALERLDAADVLVTDVVMPWACRRVELAAGARAAARASRWCSSAATPATTVAASGDLGDGVPGQAVRRRRPAARGAAATLDAARPAAIPEASSVTRALPHSYDRATPASSSRRAARAGRRMPASAGDHGHGEQAGRRRDARLRPYSPSTRAQPDRRARGQAGDAERRADQRRDHALGGGPSGGLPTACKPSARSVPSSRVRSKVPRARAC